MIVQVYANLRKGCWSVRDAKTRRVVGHLDRMALKDVAFRVSIKGRDRVRREGQKNVHAFAQGTLDAIRHFEDLDGFTHVLYDPYQHSSFVTEDGDQIYNASYVLFDIDRVVLARKDPQCLL